jgi:peroxiredoxin Q/BCP
VTTQLVLRYNLDRGEEIPMDTNDKAPEFTLLDQHEKPVSLKDFGGKTVVLFFFPKADTPG